MIFDHLYEFTMLTINIINMNDNNNENKKATTPTNNNNNNNNNNTKCWASALTLRARESSQDF